MSQQKPKKDVARIEQLVREAQEGIQDAFGEIYDIFSRDIFRYVYYRVSKDEVEDIVETVFLKAWENIKQYKPREKTYFSAWIFRIAHNLVVDYYRGRKNETVELDLNIADDDRTHHPLRFAQNQLYQQQLREAMTRLSEQHKEIITLKFINELTNKEIAEMTGKSEGSLRILQFRALRALKNELQDMGISL